MRSVAYKVARRLARRTKTTNWPVQTHGVTEWLGVPDGGQCLFNDCPVPRKPEALRSTSLHGRLLPLTYRSVAAIRCSQCFTAPFASGRRIGQGLLR